MARPLSATRTALLSLIFKMLIERDGRRRAAQQPRELALAILDGQAPQVLAIEFQEIEGAQYRLAVAAVAPDKACL